MTAWLADIASVWKQKPAFRLALLYLLVLVLLALFLPWLPLAYRPNEQDLGHAYQPPFTTPSDETMASHWLGTDVLGRDVFSNILYGARTALFLSFPVMLFATLIGVLLGTTAGYFGDKKLKVNSAFLLFLALFVFIGVYYCIYVPMQANILLLDNISILLSFATLLGVTGILYLISIVIKKKKLLQQQHYFPLDTLILRLTEMLTSIPRLIFILALASFVPPSVILLSVILVLTYWTSIARLARAEMLRLKHLPYIEAGRSLGLSSRRLLWRHALPNIASPIVVAFAFGLGGLITLEATLSFLNIGVPTTLVSWGRIIAGIKSNTSAWWLVVFPGLTLGSTVLALQTCSHYILSASQRNKQF